MGGGVCSEGHTDLHVLDIMSCLEEIHRSGFSDVMFPVSISSRILNLALNEILMWVSTDHSPSCSVVQSLTCFKRSF